MHQYCIIKETSIPTSFQYLILDQVKLPATFDMKEELQDGQLR